eukprot:6195673-Pleurochrysis_carterae.AAC.1
MACNEKEKYVMKIGLKYSLYMSCNITLLPVQRSTTTTTNAAPLAYNSMARMRDASAGAADNFRATSACLYRTSAAARKSAAIDPTAAPSGAMNGLRASILRRESAAEAVSSLASCRARRRRAAQRTDFDAPPRARLRAHSPRCSRPPASAESNRPKLSAKDCTIPDGGGLASPARPARTPRRSEASHCCH